MALGLLAGALPDDHELAMQILAELRGPRVAAAFACGGLLALAGALMQTLFRNPLAEPYLLGVSGGAGLLALLGMAAGLGGITVTRVITMGSTGTSPCGPRLPRGTATMASTTFMPSTTWPNTA